MAHIEYRLGEFTGQVGPVRFRKGHAETDDRDMVAFFVEQPETYDVTETDEPKGGASDVG